MEKKITAYLLKTWDPCGFLRTYNTTQHYNESEEITNSRSENKQESLNGFIYVHVIVYLYHITLDYIDIIYIDIDRYR